MLSAWLIALLALPFQAGGAQSIHHPFEKRLANVRQITFEGENAECYFSFDGKKLVYQSNDSPNHRDQIYTMDPDGSNRKLVSSGDGVCTCSYFSPDGKRVLYSTTAWKQKDPPAPDRSLGYVWPMYRSMQIFTANADGSDKKQLTNFEHYTAEASFRRDGRIVLTSARSGDLEIYTMAPDGSDLKRLTNEPGYDGGPFWSPDGTKIIYRRSAFTTKEQLDDYKSNLEKEAYRPGPLEIWVMEADGSNKRQVTRLGCASFGPYMHPDGEHIIFSTNYPDPNGREFDLYLIKVDGTGLERITFTKEFDGFPIFSYDGKKLIFCSNRNSKKQGDTNVFICDWVP